MSDPTYGGDFAPIVGSIIACQECGAVVSSDLAGRHLQWHVGIENALATALEPANLP